MKKILLLLVVCFSLIGRESLAFRMMGMNFNKSLHGGYREFTIHNDGMARERYKIVLTPGEETDITEYLEVYPKIVTVEPQSYKVFKIFGTAKPEDKLERREYKFNVEFNPIVVPTIKKYEGNAVSGTATMGFSPSLQMRTYAEEIDYENDLKLKDVTFYKDGNNKLRIKGKVLNESQGTLELGVMLSDGDKKIFMSKALGNVASKSEVSFDEALEINDVTKELKNLEFYDETGSIVRVFTLN